MKLASIVLQTLLTTIRNVRIEVCTQTQTFSAFMVLTFKVLDCPVLLPEKVFPGRLSVSGFKISGCDGLLNYNVS